MTFRPLPLMSLLSVLSLALLIWLGNWQYGKFRAKIAADAETPQWQSLEGDVIGGSDVLLYAYADGVSGWQRLVAVDTGSEIVWTAVELIEEINPPVITPLAPEGTRLKFSARGLDTTPSGRSVLGGADKPELRLYQTFDASRLGAGMAEPDRTRIASRLFQPDTVRFRREGRAFDAANPLARTRPDAGLPAQRHFGYALTWWGLAAALIGVYAAYHAMTGRLGFSRGG
jgi:surfeit locus 1 family protein